MPGHPRTHSPMGSLKSIEPQRSATRIAIRIQIATVVKVAMRGSKPGERRGGRKRGTPNKATVATTAALKAASADPTITPLQFLLGVMRDPAAPTGLRVQVARAAAPLVHG